MNSGVPEGQAIPASLVALSWLGNVHLIKSGRG